MTPQQRPSRPARSSPRISGGCRAANVAAPDAILRRGSCPRRPARRRRTRQVPGRRTAVRPACRTARRCATTRARRQAPRPHRERDEQCAPVLWVRPARPEDNIERRTRNVAPDRRERRMPLEPLQMMRDFMHPRAAVVTIDAVPVRELAPRGLAHGRRGFRREHAGHAYVAVFEKRIVDAARLCRGERNRAHVFCRAPPAHGEPVRPHEQRTGRSDAERVGGDLVEPMDIDRWRPRRSVAQRCVGAASNVRPGPMRSSVETSSTQ